MAKVTFSDPVRGFHGTMDGVVFYGIKGRTFIRSKGEVTKPRSEAQKAMQYAFRVAAAAWKELSGEIQETWRMYGRERGITGYNAFQRVNIPLLKQHRPMEISLSREEKPGPSHVPVTDGCIRFMASIHDMVRRISGEGAVDNPRCVPCKFLNIRYR